MPEIRSHPTKLASIRRRLAAGEYRIDTKRVAVAMLQQLGVMPSEGGADPELSERRDRARGAAERDRRGG